MNTMTANWFEGKVKYMRVDEDGRKRKVMEMYLVDAMSYTEAEARIIEEMELVVRGEYYIPSLKNQISTKLFHRRMRMMTGGIKRK